jgi:hypothetical protein
MQLKYCLFYLSDPLLRAAYTENAQGVKAEVLEVTETSLHDVWDAGLTFSTADVCRGLKGQGVQQTRYAACHPIDRRHKALTGTRLPTQDTAYRTENYCRRHINQVLPAQQSVVFKLVK